MFEADLLTAVEDVAGALLLRLGLWPRSEGDCADRGCCSVGGSRRVRRRIAEPAPHFSWSCAIEIPDSGDKPIVRSATADHAEQILRVLQAAFPRWPDFEISVPALDHLRWKMSQADRFGPRRNIVITVGGEVAGVRLRWASHVRVGDRAYVADGGADVAVHPSWQGRGIGRLLAEERDRELVSPDYISIQTPSKSPQLLHMNDVPNHILKPLSVWIRPFPLRSFVASHARSHALSSLPRNAWRRFVRGRAVHRQQAGSLEVLSAFDDRTDALWEVARQSFDLARDRSAEYLNWRYCDRRGGDAIALAVVERGDVHGYGVFKRDGLSGNVLDLVVDPGHPSVGLRLLDEGAALLRRLGVRNVVCWLPPGHRAEDALKAAAFVAVDSRTLDFRRRDQAGPAAAVAVIEDPTTRMHITMGDFDFV